MLKAARARDGENNEKGGAERGERAHVPSLASCLRQAAHSKQLNAAAAAAARARSHDFLLARARAHATEC